MHASPNSPAVLDAMSEAELRQEHAAVMREGANRDGTPPARLERAEALHAAIRRKVRERTVTVTLEISGDDARAIACVRRPDVAFDEVEPADEQEIREHLEGVIEGIREEADPDA